MPHSFFLSIFPGFWVFTPFKTKATFNTAAFDACSVHAVGSSSLEGITADGKRQTITVCCTSCTLNMQFPVLCLWYVIQGKLFWDLNLQSGVEPLESLSEWPVFSPFPEITWVNKQDDCSQSTEYHHRGLKEIILLLTTNDFWSVLCTARKTLLNEMKMDFPMLLTISLCFWVWRIEWASYVFFLKKCIKCIEFQLIPRKAVFKIFYCLMKITLMLLCIMFYGVQLSNRLVVT